MCVLIKRHSRGHYKTYNRSSHLFRMRNDFSLRIRSSHAGYAISSVHSIQTKHSRSTLLTSRSYTFAASNSNKKHCSVRRPMLIWTRLFSRPILRMCTRVTYTQWLSVCVSALRARAFSFTKRTMRNQSEELQRGKRIERKCIYLDTVVCRRLLLIHSNENQFHWSSVFVTRFTFFFFVGVLFCSIRVSFG